MIDENAILDRLHTLEGAVFALARQIDALRAENGRKTEKAQEKPPVSAKTDEKDAKTAKTPQTTFPEPKKPKSALELAELAAAHRFAIKETLETLPGWDYEAMAGPKPRKKPPRKPGYVPIDLEKVNKGVGAHLNRHRKR